MVFENNYAKALNALPGDWHTFFNNKNYTASSLFQSYLMQTIEKELNKGEFSEPLLQLIEIALPLTKTTHEKLWGSLVIKLAELVQKNPLSKQILKRVDTILTHRSIKRFFPEYDPKWQQAGKVYIEHYFIEKDRGRLLSICDLLED